jgi:hypothetical protein
VNEPGGRSRASSPASSDQSRALHPPPVAQRSFRPVESSPVGGGVRPKDRARNAALRPPAPSPSFLHFAALRSVTSAPAESAPRGPRCARLAPGAPQPPPEPRQSLTLGAAAAGRRALSLTLGQRLFALRLRCGLIGPVRWAGRSRCPRARPGLPGRGAARGHQEPRPNRPPVAGWNAGTDAAGLAPP